ncbi:hypothetical protein J437_LFUL018491 [Ladona fulva]|uniref:DUF7041 domain-containing protein n=1 Tax=Ladona fulva TaxID=123851 RepID=A0A8K0KR64_LADFU|nr:hypothetical protein J437_LFUL018491 [Ladona fulva]
MAVNPETLAEGRVAVRVPPFSPESPQLSFAQFEGHFNLTGIHDDTLKYWLVVANLDSRYAREVEDIITNLPVSDKYVKLREELV